MKFHKHIAHTPTAHIGVPARASAPATAPDVAAPSHSFGAIAVTAAPQGAIQPKLAVGAAHDPYEDEADRVAGQVMRLTDAQVQRVTPEDDEDTIRAKPDIQRLTPDEDEDTIRAKPGAQRTAEGSFDASAAAEARIAARRGGGSPLPDSTRAFMEPRFRASFAGVRIHADAEADQISQNLSARAFTTGQDIYFRQGEYRPGSSGGQALLAHELTHVLQQGASSPHRPQQKTMPARISGNSLSGKKVQRYPSIGEDQDNVREAEEWQKIEEFLRKHNQHIFHGFSIEQKIKDVNGTFIGAQGAKELSAQLLTHLNQSLSDKDHPRGQKVVMRKLTEIMELVRSARHELKNDGQRALEISRQLYNDQGLCYGFTEIYKRHAAWEKALWDAIVSWHPSGGSTEDELSNLNEHLNQTINWASGDKQERANEAVLLLKEAWKYMIEQENELELEEKQYGKFTEAFSGDALTGTKPQREPISLGQTTRLIKSPEDVEVLIERVKEVIEKLPKPIPPKLVMEISTAFHSMMASYQNNELLFFDPELWGVESCDWEGLKSKLNMTLQELGRFGESEQGFALDIEIHAQVDKNKQAASQELDDILNSLFEQSKASFQGIEENADAADFLRDYNKPMYYALFGEKDKDAAEDQ
ncbi:DUF4157 domain-containing protein [Kouleothrix sp.]|uniref:eCIS core domain-containing protein n=1 Tax=Kouleothrix sp. TaxID=2779161 RepID=UPI003919CD04